MVNLFEKVCYVWNSGLYQVFSCFRTIHRLILVRTSTGKLSMTSFHSLANSLPNLVCILMGSRTAGLILLFLVLEVLDGPVELLIWVVIIITWIGRSLKGNIIG